MGSTAEAAAEFRSAPWVATDKATAIGRKHVCEKTATGGEACSRRSRGRRSLFHVLVRETANHGEAMAARRQERNLEVWRKKRGQRPSLVSWVRVHACWGAHLREGDVPAWTRA
jgi:hypothetical protein